MAKFCGVIGYGKTTETRPGVWEDTIVEKKYYGDILRKTFKSQQSGQVLDDINISNEISIIADAFAYENFQSMRYITFMKCKWKITNAEIQYPRLILTVGGLYNENQT